MAPLNAGNIFHGRLASTIPDQSRRCPSGPRATKRASTPMASMSSSGGSTLRKGPTDSADRRLSPRARSAPLSFVLALSARVGNDGLAAPVHGQIGQADREVPPLAQPPLAADIEDLRRLPAGAGEGVHDDRHLPRDADVHALGEELRQLRSELIGDLLGDVGGGYQSQRRNTGVAPPSPPVRRFSRTSRGFFASHGSLSSEPFVITLTA